MPYLTDEEYNDLEKDLAWYKSLHAATMMRTWDEVAFELRAKNAELLEALKTVTARAENMAKLLREQGYGLHDAHDTAVFEAARAAIAKAEGN